MNFHKLVEKQVKKYLPESLQNDPALNDFLLSIHDSYNAYDKDKELSERAFLISEEEYFEVNKKLKHELDVKKQSVEKLRKTIGTITGEEKANSTDDLLLITQYLNQQVYKRKNAELVFTSLISNLHSAILLEDETRHIVFANQSFCDLFSIPVPPDSLQGVDCNNSAEESKHLFKDPDAFVASINDLLEKKALYTGELLELADGRIFQRDYIPIFLDHKYKGHLWSYTDITEDKKAQDAIEKSELTNRLILNAALDAIVIVNQTGDITFWNPQAEKTFGWKEEEVMGKKLSHLIVPEQVRFAHDKGIDNYHATGHGPFLNKISEQMAINSSGKEFPVEVSIIPVKHTSGTFFCGFIRDISERKKAEAALKESQELWQFALEGAGDGVWRYDLQTGETFFSKQYRKMLGYEGNEFKHTDKNWFNIIHRDDIALVQQSEDAYREGLITNHQLEYRIQHKDGKYLWVLDRGMILNYTEDGKPKLIIGTHTNITSIKQTELELEQRVKQFKSLSENIPGVIYEYEFSSDGKETLRYVSPALEKVFGIKVEDFYQYQQYIHPDDLPEIIRKNKHSKQTLEPFYDESRLVLPGRGIVWHSVTSSFSYYTPDGSAVFTGFILDITERKNTEHVLKINEEKYRNITANMNLGLLEVDNDEIIQFANQSFCDMSGYTSDELLGRRASELFIREEQLEMMEMKNKSRKKVVSDAYEIAVKNKSGRAKWWLISAAPRYNDKEELVGSIGIHLDITEQKNLEYELLEAREQAEQSATAKQSFLANMSHEIRTPMNAILGMSRELQKTMLNEQQKLYLNIINNAGEHLMVIINDILDISKIEAGKLSLETIGFRINDVIRNTVQVMEHRASEKGLLLNYSVDERIAPVLLGDPYRLKQILLNLLSNAVKFSEKGSVDISCRLRVKYKEVHSVQLSVTDKGIGMDKEFLQNLFQNFTQEDRSVSRKFGGTGLGMTISKQLTELMGGNITVESEKNVGTTITLVIPFSVGQDADVPSVGLRIADNSILNGKRILLVEDNDVNRLVAITTLAHYGADISEAVNGLEAVEALRNNRFDLVLMDMQMPVMDGLEATKVIRNSVNASIPIIALTANAIQGESDKCYEAGMNDFVSKPFEEESLVAMIAKWLGKEVNMTVTEKITAPVALYDLSRLNAMSKNNDAFVKKVVSLFVEQATITLPKIGIAMNTNDFALLKSQAHFIKSSIDNLGIHSLKENVRNIEKLSLKNEHSPELSALVTELVTILGKVATAMKRDILELETHV
jgi:PAS domain S-box-containing protein